jgi:transposase
MLASTHEAILQRSKTQGVGRRRRGKTSREGVAQTFSVSVPTIKRWLKRRRETADVEPKPILGRPRVKGAALEEWLPAQLQNNSDLTLEEHCEAFEEELGMAVSSSTVGRAIARLPGGGWPIKKSLP